MQCSCASMKSDSVSKSLTHKKGGLKLGIDLSLAVKIFDRCWLPSPPRWILNPPSGSSLVQWWRSPSLSGGGPSPWLRSILGRVEDGGAPSRLENDSVHTC
ncbi:uncharacterized protein LOC123987821 [Osmia bicornis bicornis]|uniref:uncharacterized protein LOC123987821 n=1 Tax=Osmia bicornis bicornis TaxID=1437191 RepID=UPI001EAEC23D|nr:uncharacterized protein LOC123987821 [Osmia bicornis bicornis]